jgi:hypothetical protein
MGFVLRKALAGTFVVAATVFSTVLAQGQPRAADDRPAPSPGAILPANPPAELTGKERLGKKWTDEQRIDNCNVPKDRRGTKPRPNTCDPIPTG